MIECTGALEASPIPTTSETHVVSTFLATVKASISVCVGCTESCRRRMSRRLVRECDSHALAVCVMTFMRTLCSKHRSWQESEAGEVGGEFKRCHCCWRSVSL